MNLLKNTKFLIIAASVIIGSLALGGLAYALKRPTHVNAWQEEANKTILEAHIKILKDIGPNKSYKFQFLLSREYFTRIYQIQNEDLKQYQEKQIPGNLF